MATLETLELRISSNAGQASGGIDSLVGSLSRLGDAVSKSLGSLNSLAQSLSSIAQSAQALGTRTMSKLFGGTGNASDLAKVKAQTSAIGEQYKAASSFLKEYKKESSRINFKSWQYGPNPAPNVQNYANSNDLWARSEEERRAANPQWYNYEDQVERNWDQISARQEALSAAESASQGMSQALKDVSSAGADTALGKVAAQASNLQQSATGAAEAIREVNAQSSATAGNETQFADRSRDFTNFGNAISGLKKGVSDLFSGVTSFMGRIASIATRMLIRKAIKMVAAAAKEGTDNMYQYSKSMGTTFSSSMDSMSSSLAQLKNAAGTAIAPALSAIIPVLNSIASAAITAFNALSQLFALLSGSTTWTRATAQATEYAEAVDEATGGGGGGSNEGLAEFDQLDLIASESGGGGGGGSGGIDYASMFEEVGEFSEEIKALVSWIEDHMDSILGLAIAIGAAILAWKVSEAFTGLLSKLAGLAAAGLVIAITAQLVWLFDQEYLKSGDIGWLVADLLTTALGATIAGMIVGQILGGAWGYYAAGFTFLVSALTSIIALLGATDVSALSQEGILLALVAAIKAGAGVALIAYGNGYTIAKSVEGGIGAALVTFGVVIGLKAIIDDSIEGLSIQLFEAAILSAVSTGAGVFFLAHGLANMSASEALELAGGVALITFGAVVGLKAIVSDDVEALSTEHIVGALTSAVSTGAGVYLLGKGMLNWAKEKALEAGGGVALITFGAVVAMKALLSKDVDSLSETNFVSAITSAVSVGAGILLLEKGLLDASTAAALEAGGLAALITFAAVVGIKAAAEYIESDDTEESIAKLAVSSLMFGVIGAASAVALGAGAIAFPLGTIAALSALIVEIGLKANAAVSEWGELELTAEEVQAFVEEKMFNVDVKTVCNIIAEHVNVSENTRQNIEDELTRELGTLKIIELGLADSNDYADLKDQIDSLIAKCQEYVTLAQDTAKLTLQFTPTLVGETEEEQSKWYESYTSGWDTVNDFFTKQGEKLGNLLVENEKGQIEVREPEVLAAIMEQINNVTEAIARADIASSAYSTFAVQMGDLSERSAEDVATLFKQYKEQLTESYTELVNEQYIKQGELVAALFEIDPDSEEYKQAYDDYIEMGKNLSKAVEDGVKASSTNGRELVMQWLLGQYGEGGLGQGVTGADAWNLLLQKEGLTGEKLREAIQTQLYNLGADPLEIELMDLVGFTGWEFMSKDLQQGLIEYLGITPQTMATLRDGLSLSAQDIVEIYDWDKLEEDQKQNLISSLVNGMGSSETFSYLKDQFTFTAEDIISFANWDSFSMKEKLNFLTALATAFGNSEALSAAENAGIKIGDLVKEGMESKDPDVQAAAKAFAQLVQDEVEGINPTIDATANISVEIDTKINVSTNNGEIKSATTTDIRAAAGTNNRPTITPFATGAYNIPRGDVFIANEAGAELVGQINGRTSVANQQQIIEGIQRGVAEANNEQNALLRRQNELLTAILKKDQSVRIGASTALGRTVRESLDLYEIAAGGR